MVPHVILSARRRLTEYLKRNARTAAGGSLLCGEGRKVLQRQRIRTHLRLEIGSDSFSLVRETGLEPVRHKHTPLKRACLPIPALALNKKYYTIIFTFVNVFLYAAGKSAVISSSAPCVDIPPRPCYNRHA